MTKHNARAILKARDKVNAVMDQLELTLKDDELTYFLNYWGAHIRASINGQGYGTAPIDRAKDAVGEP